RRQIGDLKNEIHAMETGTPGDTSGAGGSALFMPAMEVPKLRANLENLMREEKVRETVFLMLTQRYESLKLEEARDLATFWVCDEAVTPTYRVRPTRLVIVGGFAGGLIFGALFIIVPAWWRDLGRRAAVEGASEVENA